MHAYHRLHAHDSPLPCTRHAPTMHLPCSSLTLSPSHPLAFSAWQLALLEAAAAASAAPLIVLVLSAVPLDLTPLLEHPKVGAILHLGQPSVQTSGAADVLFGA
eukprot:scaffold25251_cov65-Phaeocystis_antarctica.AAC.11